jgi:hypothetical protein
MSGGEPPAPAGGAAEEADRQVSVPERTPAASGAAAAQRVGGDPVANVQAHDWMTMPPQRATCARAQEQGLERVVERA